MPIPEAQTSEVLRLHQQGMNFTQIGARVKLHRSTVSNIVNQHAAQQHHFPEPRLPDPAPEAGGPSLPDSWAKPMRHLDVDTPGHWLVLGDVHLPMHDRTTVEAAVTEARNRNAVGLLLNGDIMDMFGISPFFRIPTRERFVDEIDVAKRFLAWIRSRLPQARIVYRQGNHEARYVRYVADRAQALFDLPSCQLPEILGLPGLGIEWVQDKVKVNLGKLTTLHGHELRKGEGVNPARLAFLRTTGSVMVGHWHRPSEHHQRSLDDKHYVCWSHGCACYLNCDYDPYNQWGHGFAMVELFQDGHFSVSNKKLIRGQVV